MTQKLYRDSKGRFVSRDFIVGNIKLNLEYMPRFVKLGSLGVAHALGREVCRLRNKHKIYETF